MLENKEAKVRQFREWLIGRDLRFIEKANGHFQILDINTGKLTYQVWATTETMIDKTELKRWRGMADIKRELTGENGVKKLTAEMCAVRQAFLGAYEANKGHMYDCTLVVAVHLPTGATEIITNHYDVETKMKYYIDAYDEAFRKKEFNEIKVTGFMLV